MNNPADALTGDALTVNAAQSLMEGQGYASAEAVAQSAPGAVRAREESLTKYEGLSSEAAIKLASEVFPAVKIPEGGLPELATGQSVVAFPSLDTAEVDLGNGRRGLIESTEPLAVETSPEKRVPLDLTLNDVGNAFEPRAAVAGVRIPKRLGSGVAVTESGLSLTPVDSEGVGLGSSEGVMDGASVFYANTQTDSDTIVKPTTLGFEASTILRSVNSPRQLFFRVGLPSGARLQSEASGVVQVVSEGVVVATVQAPIAVDALGQYVPVSMTISGNTLVLSVDVAEGEYEYPIRVDPNVVTDKELLYNPGNWAFFTDNSKVFVGSKISKGGLLDGNESNGEGKYETYFNGQYGFFSYTTQGASRIYAFVASTREIQAGIAPSVNNEFELRRGNGEVESGNGEGGKARIIEPTKKGETEHTGITVCAEAACGPVGVSGSEENAAYFEQKATGEENGLFRFTLTSASVEIQQERSPTASFDTSDATIEGVPNALLSGKWYKPTATATLAVDADDPGIGVYKQGLSSPSKSGWGYAMKHEARNECQGAQCNQCYEPACAGKASGNGKPLTFGLATGEGGELPDGEDTVEGKVEDDTGLKATATAKVKIDKTPPYNITLTGLPSNHELRDGQHVAVKASATDGTNPTPSSGIASIVLQIDGQQIGGPQGSCTPGQCTANAEWTLSGENYAAGKHTLTVVATDNAGNSASAEYEVTIHHPENVAAGPGVVNPITGELNLTATDVSQGVPDGTLTVSRSYRSNHLAQGAEGPLGPQWTLSLGAEQSLTRVTGGMVLTGGNGGQIVFASNGKGGFTAPTGDAGMTLTEKTGEKGTIFTLSENGSVTTFEVPIGGSGGVWMPSSAEGPGGTNTALYKYKMTGGVIEPYEELAPQPAGVSCGKEISELKEGCRALKFEYAKETKARGESASEWGSFNGHLAEVIYIAWNASKTKTETKVAEYAYDAKGRLRAVWDPRVTPSPLKTTYGYDAEGHVTAISSAGHEPTLLEYGTIPSDASTGRLLAVSVPSASTALGSGEAPVSKEVPTLSSTKPVVGTKISVNLVGEEKTPGTWSAGPLAFIYQWEDCNSGGKECTPIPGAVNQAYYPVPSDEGHTLVAQAIALNAAGATVAASAVTSTVATGTPNTPLPEPPVVGSNSVTTLEYQVPVSGSGAPYQLGGSEVGEWGQTDVPNEAMAIFPPDKVMGWPAKKYERETVYYVDVKDRAVNVANASGGIATTEYNAYNDAMRTLSADNRKKAMEETGKTVEASKLLDTESHYEEEGSEPGTELLSTLGPQHTVKLAVGKEGKHNEEVLARQHVRYFYNEGAPSKGGPYRLVTKTIDGAETTSKEEFDTRTTEMSYGGQSELGWTLRKPTSVTTDPGGLNLVHTTEYNSLTGAVTETKMPAANGKDATVPPTYKAAFGSKGSGAGQFNAPNSATIDANQHVWVTDYTNNRVEEFSSTDSFIRAIGFGVSTGEAKFQICTTGCKAGIPGAGEGQFSGPVGISYQAGGIYVADYNNDRVEKFTESGEYVSQFGTKGKGTEQIEGPVSIATTSSDVWVGDINNNRVDEFTLAGKFVETIGFGVSTGEAKFQICTTGCKAGIAGSGEGQFSSLQGLAISGTNLYVADFGNNRIEEFGEKGEYTTKFGTKGKGSGAFEGPVGIATNPVSGNLYVTDWGNNRVEGFTPAGAYLDQFGTKGTGNGQFSGPEGLAITATQTTFVVDTGDNRVEEWVATVTGNEGAHDTKTIYYTKEGNSEYPSCGGYPEMANLVCETTPAAQPGTSGLPERSVTKYSSYNVWSEPETITETVGTTTRTKTNTYDSAGRLKTAGISSPEGTALSATTYEYNSSTGAMEKQCRNSGKPCTEGSPKTITAVTNKLGELTSYTDADENTASYEYDVDGRPTKINDGKGTQTYTYSTTSGLPIEVVDSSHEGMKFTGSYDVEGNLLTEGYPNGMTATYTYDATGKPIKLIYKKMTNCVEVSEKCKWLKDTVVPSIHGQWIEQTGTLSKQVYNYDNAGRLTEVKNTPTGQGCTVRLYTYDEDTNRVGFTTRAPGSEGKCATEGGTTETHTYDTADRMTDTGTNYNTFGDIISVPAQGSEDPELTSTYYVDDQVASQKQSKQTIGYNLDPAGRTRETVATGEPNNADTILHYASASNSPSWTSNPTSGEWSRNIPGINGNLAAIQSNGETPELELTNLHGDIIAKAYLSETATELSAKADTSEFGVPTVAAPAKYSWLGAIELPTELPSGAITMGVRSYIPQLGRFLQPDPISGGSANAYSYTFGDPVNSNDPTGAYTNTASAAILAIMAQEGQAIAEARKTEIRHEAVEAEERRGAELAAIAAAEAAAAAAADGGGEEYGEWEEFWEEEGWYEEVAYHPGTKGQKEGHSETAVLYQPLSGMGGDGGIGMLGSTAPLCDGGVEGPCMRTVGGVGRCSHGGCKKFSRPDTSGPHSWEEWVEGICIIGGWTAFTGPPCAVAGAVIYAKNH